MTPSNKYYRACEHCGCEYEVRRRDQKYCCKQCLNTAFNQSRPRVFPVPSGPLVCRHCGVNFVASRAWCKYCSSNCSYMARQQRLKMAGKTGRLITAKCLQCQKEFQQSKRYYNRTEPKFCSTKCAGLAKRGVSSAMFRGPSKSTRGKTWEEIAQGVRRRDFNSCCICEFGPRSKNANLPVDHVIPERVMWELGLYPHTTDNLVTLCRSCHSKKTHAELPLLEGRISDFMEALKNIGYPMKPAKSMIKNLLQVVHGGS